MAFCSDIRFRMESLSQIRIAFCYCQKLSQAITPDLLRTKLLEKNDEIGTWHLKEFDTMQLEERIYTSDEWHSNFCQAEKFLFDSFS